MIVWGWQQLLTIGWYIIVIYLAYDNINLQIDSRTSYKEFSTLVAIITYLFVTPFIIGFFG